MNALSAAKYFLFITMYVIIGCSGNTQTIATSSTKPVYDTSKIAVLPMQQIALYTSPVKIKSFSLTQSDFALIDTIIKCSIIEYNAEFPNSVSADERKINLAKNIYRFQYVPFVNINNEKIVYVNGFCSAEKAWREELITADDGGNCYFNLIINLTTKKCSHFYVNGEG